MKKIILLASACLAAVSIQAKEVQKVTVTTNPQMHCAGCENKIKNFFKFEKGIKKIETSVPDQTVTITYDADKTSEQTIIDSFSKIKYEVKKVNEPKQDQKEN